MKQYILGILVGATLVGTAWAAGEVYSVELFNDATIDAESLACAKAGGRGAILFDLIVEGDSYSAVRAGNACVKVVK